MARSEKRVVLVKPGDVPLIGNLGSSPAEVLEGARALAKFLATVGISAALFSEDIDLDMVPGGSG
ncbi:hypothetical protein ACFWNG_03885 [Streptomyces sp. NPDC058391]|uniref:hypothetical protein n=1 Tax=Streptomyces sp. NPDC058391 TaxID=3346476 RepID=UPI00364B40AC